MSAKSGHSSGSEGSPKVRRMADLFHEKVKNPRSFKRSLSASATAGREDTPGAQDKATVFAQILAKKKLRPSTAPSSRDVGEGISQALSRFRQIASKVQDEEGDSDPGELQISQLTLLAYTAVQMGKEDIREELNRQYVDPTLKNSALFFFGPENRLRKICIRLKQSFTFESIVMSAIVGSCFMTMVTPPSFDIPRLDPLLDENTISTYDFYFILIFTAEFFVRVMADGLILHEGAYLRDSWNRLDSLVLFFAWVDEFGLLGNEGKAAKVFRLARALRPLRLMKRNPGLRIAIDALLKAIPPALYVVLYSWITTLAFAVLGMGKGDSFRFD